MPNKKQIRRLSAIVQVLNDEKARERWIFQEDLRKKVIEKIDMKVCKSTIDKDLFYLREEYDFPLEGSRYGLKLKKQVNFLHLLKEHLNLF
jgi:hypothetical protein